MIYLILLEKSFNLTCNTTCWNVLHTNGLVQHFSVWGLVEKQGNKNLACNCKLCMTQYILFPQILDELNSKNNKRKIFFPFPLERKIYTNTWLSSPHLDSQMMMVLQYLLKIHIYSSKARYKIPCNLFPSKIFTSITCVLLLLTKSNHFYLPFKSKSFEELMFP